MTSDNDEPAAEVERLLATAPDIRTLELLLPDMTGILRGKRLGRDEFSVPFADGIKFSAATTLMDTSGCTIPEVDFGGVDGDPDVIAQAVPGSLAPVPWLGVPGAQALLTLTNTDGTPYYADPRVVLRSAVQPLQAMGLEPTVAMELEFYLLDGGGTDRPVPKLASVPGTQIKQEVMQFAMLEDLWDLEGFLAEIEATCAAQHIPATSALSEFAPGQFEINLHHVDDPTLACDHAVLLKRAIKGVARAHGLGASFMAKTFAEQSGSGLHVHIGLRDTNGRNVFWEQGSEGVPPLSATMRHAVGGLQVTMDEAMALFAPNANSYRRLQPHSFVPLQPRWGYNHRSVALRIPLSDAENLRIEHRVAGADANPYLVLAALFAGIHHGITNAIEPTAMVTEGALIKDDDITLPVRWDDALDRFARSTVLPRYLGEDYARVYEVCRRSECNRFHAELSDRDYAWYLRSV